MVTNRKLTFTVFGLSLAWLAACGQQHFPAALGLSLEDMNEIRTDSSLSAQEKREQLREMGVGDVQINGILRGETFGNQFGGTLETAFAKVDGGSFASMTPDEVQLYSDAVSVNFSDAEAQATVGFFVTEPINNAEELTAFLDNPGNELDPAIVETELRTVFIDTDPDDLIDLLP